jgi:hypothetical protein
MLSSAFGGKKDISRDSDGSLRKNKAIDIINFNDSHNETEEDQI